MESDQFSDLLTIRPTTLTRTQKRKKQDFDPMKSIVRFQRNQKINTLKKQIKAIEKKKHLLIASELLGLMRLKKELDSWKVNEKNYTHQYTGEWSSDAIRKINQCFNWLNAISTRKKVFSKKSNSYFYFRMSAITLTLSDCQVHSDAEIQSKMLSPFLELMKKCYGMNSYIWKTEPQSNGNWHAHITTNVYIQSAIVANVWNALQNKMGYLANDNYSDVNRAKASTQIKAIKNETAIKNYFIKEIIGKKKFCKSEHHQWTNKRHYYFDELMKFEKDENGINREVKRKMHSQIWNCSMNLKNKFLRYDCIPEIYDKQWQGFKKEFIYKTLECNYAKIYILKSGWQHKIEEPIKSHYKKLLQEIASGDDKQLQFFED